MISAFNGFSRVIHDNIIVSYFTRLANGYILKYTLPGHAHEHIFLHFESTDFYDSLSYIKINGKKYDCDNMEKNFDRIQMLITQENNLRAIEALP